LAQGAGGEMIWMVDHDVNGNSQLFINTVYGAIPTTTQTTDPALGITTSSLPNGTVGSSYSQSLAATGGTAPYKWAITSGTLPAGLSLSSGGVISGTPITSCSSVAITFQVTDDSNATAKQVISIAINSSPLNITTSSLPNGTVGSPYSQSLTATGGTAPYKWAITLGTLPAGLSLSSGGVISGTPTTSCNSVAITFNVTDNAGVKTTKALSIQITSNWHWGRNRD